MEFRLLVDSLPLLVPERVRLPLVKLSPVRKSPIGQIDEVQVLSPGGSLAQTHVLEVELQVSTAIQTDEALQELLR